MSLFQRVEVIELALLKAQSDITALQATPTSGVTSEQLAAVQTQIDGLRADVGTPSTPPTV